MPLEQFLDRMDALIEQIRASELAPGSTGVFLPGEMEHNQKQDRLVNGVPLDPKTGALTKCFSMGIHQGAWKRLYPATGFDCDTGDIVKFK